MAKFANEKYENGEWVHDEDKTRRDWDRAYVKDGVVRWKSNDNVPFEDMLRGFETLGFEFDMQASIAARNKDTQEFLEKLEFVLLLQDLEQQILLQE